MLLHYIICYYYYEIGNKLSYPILSYPNLARYFPPWTVTRSQWAEMTRPAISGVVIDTLLFSRIGVPLFHRYRIVSRGGTHVALHGTYMRLLHSFLSRHAVARRTVSRARRQRNPVRGAGSSCALDMVSLPPAEAYTVQALMDLALPRFAGLGDGPRQVHAPWAMSTDSPASPAASRLDTSGEEDRKGLGSPCLDLDGLSSSDDDIGTLGGLSDLSVTMLCDDNEVSPVNSDQVLSDVDFPPEPGSYDKQTSADVIPRRTSCWWMLLRYVGRGTLGGALHGFPRVNVCRGRFP